MSFDVNILVNGNRCKQHHFKGKTFVQANPDSEYVLEIKNNHWKRILAVCSVDGLNILTGKAANEEDTGYIINSYSTEKIKGFRISDSEWALFKFGYKFKGNTYAQSKEDGSDKNCGIFGIRLFYEKEQIVINTPSMLEDYYIPTGTTNYTANVNYMSNTLGQIDLQNAITDARSIGATACAGLSNSQPMMDMSSDFSREATKGGSQKMSKKRSYGGGCSVDYAAMQCSAKPKPAPENFDMGTEFGRRESSKVRNVDFDRGCLAQSFDIYYASRQSLINMGIPLDNVLQANLPQSFDQYATPPKNWVG